MKILMTSNIIFPEVAQQCGLEATFGGGWLIADVKALKDHFPELEIAVLTVSHQVKTGEYQGKDAIHHVIQAGSFAITRWPDKNLIEQFRRVIFNFRPDIIYVQGTEYNYGLAVRIAAPEIPAVVAMQGLLCTCIDAERKCMNASLFLRARTLGDWIDRLLYRLPMEKRQARLEVQVLQRFHHVIGRTQWTRAYSRAIVPAASYHHVDRVMRSEFYGKSWSFKEKKSHQIFTIAGALPRKGLHTLIEAVGYLKQDFPDLRLRIPGIRLEKGNFVSNQLQKKGYENYLCYLIEKWGLQNHICGIANLPAADVAMELMNAHVFVMPSFIENASTSLCEAMLIGTPSIAAFVGGTSSITHDRTESLMYPAGDAVLLAEHIRSLFLDETLCQKLSRNARETALRRHDPGRVAHNLLGVFNDVLS